MQNHSHGARGSLLLSPHEVAQLLLVDARTLANWAWRGQGPAFVRIGRRRLYLQEDVDDYIASRRFAHRGAEQAARGGA